jgi:hypothetical protein
MFERRFEFGSLKRTAINCTSFLLRNLRQQQPDCSQAIALKSNLMLTCSYYNSVKRKCQVIYKKKSEYRHFFARLVKQDFIGIKKDSQKQKKIKIQQKEKENDNS